MPFRDFLWSALKTSYFKMDAEAAHHRAAKQMLRLQRWGGDAALRWVSGAPKEFPHSLRRRVLGMNFGSPIGLAAGFDKNAELVKVLPALGFGFAEIGTVTPLPQPGNDRPRLFRDIERQALFNLMGFNNDGAEIVAKRIAKVKRFLPSEFRLGINLGKNKNTPLESAAFDYVAAVSPFAGLVDYVVVNVSSPNTPGLRELQQMEFLKPILDGVCKRISLWNKPVPLLLKLAPELDRSTLMGLVTACEKYGVDGWILTNTLAGDLVLPSTSQKLKGGWSGAPLEKASFERLVWVRALTKKPIISVGGIMNAEEAMRRLSAGADLIQIYSGWIFNGPQFPAQLANELATYQMKQAR